MGWKTAQTAGSGVRAMAGVLALGFLAAVTSQAQTPQTSTSADAASTQTPLPASTRTTLLGKIGPAAPVTYDNRYELYGGINFMNFQAGQNLPKRMNMGGGEILGTYWFNKHIGAAANYRFEAGTTPVLANAATSTVTNANGSGINNRPLVYMNIGMLGVQYRGPKNQYVAVDYHAYAGVASGIFSYSLKDVPASRIHLVGLYGDSVKPIAAVGASLDFNQSKKWAIRLSPDLIFEHFGSETREFFAISGGVVYRFNKKDTKTAAKK